MIRNLRKKRKFLSIFILMKLLGKGPCIFMRSPGWAHIQLLSCSISRAYLLKLWKPLFWILRMQKRDNRHKSKKKKDGLRNKIREEKNLRKPEKEKEPKRQRLWPRSKKQPKPAANPQKTKPKQKLRQNQNHSLRKK